ncbi:MAG: T9SS type B sorting domain-containing protein, partial [Bacteroidales bacterium]|nr:T9SS type B sorting domain-containing protein [Candidatus Scybalocola fimicaballi]
IDASVTINTLSDDDVTKCEKDDYKIVIDVESKGGTPVREWYKDGDVYKNNSDELSFSPLMKKDEGEYKVEYHYEGCWADLPVVNLKVKEYVKVDVADYEMYESKKSYIVISGDDANVEFKFTVPSDASDVSALKATLTDKASRNKGTMSSGNETFGISGVDEDHPVKVEFESDDYCAGDVEFQVLRDAKLVLHAHIDTAMCLNENKPFTIDTIGTGKFRRPGATLVVTSVSENGSESQEKGFSSVRDTLKKNVSPRTTTTYNVEFTYGKQKKDTSIKVTVYNFKVEPIHQTICSGEEVALKATVTPAGSKIEWFEQDKETSLGENPGMLSPVFDGAVSAAKSQHRYWARPYSDLVTCSSSGMTPLVVDVFRPLEGEIEDKTICEGEDVRLDAGSYGAQKYKWVVNGDTIPGNRYYQDTPTTDTEYHVIMSRGDVCTAEDKAKVTVKSNPVIESIDSISYREVEIVMAPDFGTPVFRFQIDGGEWTENTHLTGLAYTIHTINVEDANGCKLKDTFLVKDPVIEIPHWFSPNNDGEFDKWTVPGIKETYPEAEFTIFDRWGKKLVEFKGEEDGWDGTYNGVDMPTTDYWYELIVREIDKIYTGHFTLIRR